MNRRGKRPDAARVLRRAADATSGVGPDPTFAGGATDHAQPRTNFIAFEIAALKPTTAAGAGIEGVAAV